MGLLGVRREVGVHRELLVVGDLVVGRLARCAEDPQAPVIEDEDLERAGLVREARFAQRAGRPPGVAPLLELLAGAARLPGLALLCAVALERAGVKLALLAMGR